MLVTGLGSFAVAWATFIRPLNQKASELLLWRKDIESEHKNLRKDLTLLADDFHRWDKRFERLSERTESIERTVFEIRTALFPPTIAPTVRSHEKESS